MSLNQLPVDLGNCRL